MATIKEIFLKFTKKTYPTGTERVIEELMPSGYKKDFHGNFYYLIGDEPTTMFSAHVDTADSAPIKDVTHVFEGDIIKTDGKTILGADDKAGVAIMIHMMDKKVPGLYYFFLGEERGRIGSTALYNHLKSQKDDLPAPYKKINKVIAFDRSGTDNLITFQNSERCCSEAFGKDLCSKLNAAGDLSYKNDPSGLYTDSYSFIELYPECTNLSVGYKHQHTPREFQDIAFLQKLADACVKVDWESLVIERDPSKTEYASYYGGSTYWKGGGSGRGTSTGGSRGGTYYDWEEDQWWGGSAGGEKAKSTANATGEYVTDYLGDSVKRSDAVFCEHDKEWCLKKDAIWVDYVGFYTTPDIDPNKVKKPQSNEGGLTPIKKEDVKVGTEIYLNGKLYGKVTLADDKKIEIKSGNGMTMVTSPAQIEMKEFQIKKSGNKILTKAEVRDGLIVTHPIFGEGKITSVRTDKSIIRVTFRNGTTKDLMVNVAQLTY